MQLYQNWETVKELSHHCEGFVTVPSRTLHSYLKRLAERGLVKRKIQGDEYYYTLTKKGEAMLERWEEKGCRSKKCVVCKP